MRRCVFLTSIQCNERFRSLSLVNPFIVSIDLFHFLGNKESITMTLQVRFFS